MTHEFLVCLTEPVQSSLSVSKPYNTHTHTHPRVNHTLPNDSLSLSLRLSSGNVLYWDNTCYNHIQSTYKYK